MLCFAREYCGSPTAALGKRIHDPAGARRSEIVGVVGDVRQDGVDHRAPSFVYWPVLASYLPTAKVISVDPVEALRAE